MKIEGLVAVVSGGASGLGEATARHLAALGAQVAIVDFDKDKAEAVARDIGGLSVQTDVSDEKSVSEAFDSVESQLGAPRIACLLYTSPSPRDRQKSRMPSSA